MGAAQTGDHTYTAFLNRIDTTYVRIGTLYRTQFLSRLNFSCFTTPHHKSTPRILGNTGLSRFACPASGYFVPRLSADHSPQKHKLGTPQFPGVYIAPSFHSNLHPQNRK
jgi:hypothetical protein